MANPTRVIAAALVAALLAGCVSSTAVPVRRDVWRLQVALEPGDPPGRVKARVLREAAGVAFDAGYPFFLLEPAAAEDPTAELGRAILIGRTRGIVPTAATAPAATATVRVVLLEREDPRAAGAFDTLKVLNP